MSTSNKKNLSKGKQVILNDLHELKSAAQSFTGDISEYDFTGKISKLAHDFYHIANDEYDHAKDELRHRVQNKPLEAVIVAFGIGYLLRALRG